VAQGHGDGDGDVAIGFWDVGLGDMDTRTWELGEVGTWGLGCDKQKTNDVFAECVKSYD